VSRSTKTSGVEQVPPPERPEAGPDRVMRADARRNHDTLLAAGATVFAERGADASMEEIARQAGVGIGTLYRHFPTRDALTEAVYRREVERLCDGVDDLLATNPADVALALWMRNFAGYVAAKKGMAAILKSSLGVDNELFTYSHKRIRHALETLVAAAVDAGTIRSDADPDDLMRGMSGICMATDQAGWPDRTGRLIDLLVDGLRYGAPVRA
jgi:AcrR family transcriptional regulator